MNNSGNFADKWSRMFTEQKDEVIADDVPMTGTAPLQVPETVSKSTTLSLVLKVFYHFRKLIMAIPVAYYALKLALYNVQNLPEQVGIDLQSSGEFARMISKESAVTGPLMVTGICLLLMFLSRKTVYPWLISIFTLILPVVILLTNLYPM